ncbi:hypothetical protein QCA50_013797 [Cerrena zonata]|uniref:non-specific serine/threonine protein kinase n=1 Tax=Cerrena zonata TaxID=2478898 RepID=A0AAW0FY58_9APHY
MSARVPSIDFTGRVLDHGRYQCIQKLGSGTYGVVYRAIDYKTNPSKQLYASEVAIKILRKTGTTEREQDNIKRERMLHRVMSEHPNIVTMRHDFDDENHIYIVLDYCPGGDLFSKIRDEGVFWRNDALIKKIFIQIIDSVEACHVQGIYHRDLKPENILCSADGTQVFLSDFGLATQQRVSNTFGCGSSFYMSPECIGEETDGIPYAPKYSDVWALGVILLNMVTGRAPWERAITTDDCFHDYLIDKNFLRQMLPISRQLSYVMRKVFELDPSERLTLRELRNAVHAMKSFFMDEQDIAIAPRGCQIAVKEMVAHVAAINRNKCLDKVVENFDKLHIKEEAVRRAAPLHKEPSSRRKDTPISTPDGSPTSSHAACPIVGDDETETESGSDLSSGLVTPTNYPNESLLEVPDITESLGLDWISTIAAKLRKAIEPVRGPLRVVNQTKTISA